MACAASEMADLWVQVSEVLKLSALPEGYWIEEMKTDASNR